MSFDAWKRVPPLVSQTVLKTEWISGFEAGRIKSARLPAQRRAIPPTAKLEIVELRLIVWSDLAPGANKRKVGQ
jgi:hypothetical protein